MGSFSDLERFDMGIQTRFMTRCLVLVHDALGHGFVDGGYGVFVSRFGRLLIARVDRLQNFLDRRTYEGTLAGVLPAMALCLTGSFSS